MPELSPAAQAVLDAAHDGANGVLFDIGDDSPVPMCVAAALRAAADQVVPENGDINMLHRVHQSVRYHLLAIAAELESHV